MSRSQRRKGADGEREAADLLRPVFPDVRRRCAGEESQGGRGRDLDGTPGYCFQVQVSGTPAIERKFREAVGASYGEVPVALTRRVSRVNQGQPWLATLRAEDLVMLLVDARINLPLVVAKLKEVEEAAIREHNAREVLRD